MTRIERMTAKALTFAVMFMLTANLVKAEQPLTDDQVSRLGLEFWLPVETHREVVEQTKIDPFHPTKGAYWHWLASAYTLQVQGAALIQCQIALEGLKPRVGRFLWKPVSERDGKLAVLVDLPDVDVVVENNGRREILNNTGASNGYGTTGRSKYTGCDWGKHARLSFEKNGQVIPIFDSRQPYVSVDDGCYRNLGES